MEDLELEALQRASYEEDLKTAEYSFTCNDDGVICHESPKITIEGKGVRLSFLRYGVLDKATPVQYEEDVEAEEPKAVIAGEETAELLVVNNKTDKVYAYDTTTHKLKEYAELDEVIVTKNKFEEYGVPKLENFNIARTALTTGYIYLINKENSNEYYELAVDEQGMLSHILWEYSKDKETGEYLDVRKQQKEKISYKIVKEKKKLYVAFSPVQWSRDYFNEINASDDKKKAVMKLIDCSGFPKDYQAEETADVLPFHQVKATFQYDHPYTNVLQENLNDIFITEREQTQKAEEEGGDANNDILEDMFITFHDPTAVADEICVGIDKEVTRLQAIMTSLQTGKPTEEIFLLLMKGEKVPVEDSKTTRQIQYLFRLAQISYDFVYNNDDNTDTYGEKNVGLIPNIYSLWLLQAFYGHGGASKEKLEKILAVTERATQRAIINSYRDDLGNLMKSDYYQDALEYYFSGIADDVEDAKGIVAEHFIALGQYPNMYDRHLDLKNEYKLASDNWYKRINETLYNPDPEYFKNSTKILDTTIYVQDVNVLSLIKKTTKQIEKIFKAYANHETYVGAFVALKQKKMPITGKVSYFRDKKTRETTIKFKSLENFETEINGKKLKYEINGKPATLKQYKKHWHLEYEKMTKQSVEKLINHGKLEVNLKTNLPKRFKNEVEKLLKSNAFAGVVLMIEAYVWGKAVKQFAEDPSKYKNKEKLAFSSIKLAAASGTLIRELKLYDKFLIKKGYEGAVLHNKVDIFGRRIAVLKIASSAITVFTASRDSYLSFSARDNDAATIYAMAAGIGATFLAADVAMLVSGSAAVFALGFWPAALLGGALIGCYYLAAKYFKDSELEAYFKNYPLSDFALVPNVDETSQQYIVRLAASPSKAINDPWFDSVQSDEFKTYSNFEKAYTALLDILVPSVTIVEPQPHEFGSYRKGFDKHNAITNHFKAYIYSAQKINDFSELDVKAWYYPHGIIVGIPDQYRIEITSFYYEDSKMLVKSYQDYGAISNDDGDELIPNFGVGFKLPPEYYWNFEKYKYGEVLFVCRIRVDDAQYTPTNFNSAPRYIFGFSQTHNERDYNWKHMTGLLSAFRYGKRVGVRNLKLTDIPKEEALLKPKIISENSIPQLESYFVNL